MRIVAYIEKDDGIQKTSYLELEATVDEAPRRFTLNPKVFQGSEWPIENLGPGAIVDSARGSKERLREAIQRVSRDWQRRSVYTHTGWREINGRWVFLHANGALGAMGPLQGIEVQLDAKLWTEPRR